MKIEYCELKQKEVVSVTDGKKLGKIIDCLIDSNSGQILGVILPGERGFARFRNSEECYVSWDKIAKIGDDVILVEISKRQPVQQPPQEPQENPETTTDTKSEPQILDVETDKTPPNPEEENQLPPPSNTQE